MIDTHAHLDDRRFNKDRDEVIKESKAKLRHVFLPASLPGTPEKNLALAQQHKGFLYAMAGMDPVSCLRNKEGIKGAMDWARGHAKDVIAIGEVGLDYFHAPDRKEEQISNFNAFIALANELHLPLVIHCRDAWGDCLAALKQAETNVIMHCFSGTKAESKRCEDAGFTLSLATNACWPNATLINDVSLDIMVLETDSPYLHPSRAGRNVPANVWETAARVSEIKGAKAGEVEKTTDRNALKAFML